MKFNHQKPEALSETMDIDIQQQTQVDETSERLSDTAVLSKDSNGGMTVEDVNQRVNVIKDTYIKRVVADAKKNTDEIQWQDDKGQRECVLEQELGIEVKYTAVYSKVIQIANDTSNPVQSIENVLIDRLMATIETANETIELVHNCHSSIDQVPSKKMWEFSRDAHKVYRKYIKLSNFYKL
jgi:hypothetical protein